MSQLKWHFGGFAIQRKQVIRERWGGRTRRQGFILFGFYALCLLLVLSLSCGDEAAQAPVVLDELDGVNGEAAGLGGDVQHGGGTGFVCRRLVQGRILDLHSTKLTLQQVKGAAAGLVGGNRDLAPVSQHFYIGHLSCSELRRLPSAAGTKDPCCRENHFGQQHTLELGWRFKHLKRRRPSRLWLSAWLGSRVSSTASGCHSGSVQIESRLFLRGEGAETNAFVRRKLCV